jgi:Fe-S cluster assembly protein SufD
MTIHQTTIRPAPTAAEQRYLDLYASVADSLPGARHVNVRKKRETALGLFASLGLPHRRVEEWKYTDLRALMPEVHPLAGLAASETAAGVSVETAIGAVLANLDACRVVFVDGQFRPELSTARNAPGVTFQHLRSALDQGACAAFGFQAEAGRDEIAALTGAFATDGALVSVAPNARLTRPIHLIFIASEGAPKLAVVQNTVEIGDGAEVQLIETHAVLGQSQALAYTRIMAGSDARLSHVRVTAGAKQLASAFVALEGRTHYEPVQVTVDGQLTRAQMRIRFNGPHARCHYSGAMLLRGQAHADFTLVVDHAAEACESREVVKAVLDGRSRGVFQGKVIVRRGAQKTDGRQTANALLLSNDAEFDSKPELEIFADDVACGHGSTAGQIDEDLMFYLKARGIPEVEARALLIAAFVGEALDGIGNEALRAALQEKVDGWLGGK